MSIGRPQKPYRTSYGEVVPGLYKCPDGRWRFQKAGIDTKFTEPDERRAVARFRSMYKPETVNVPSTIEVMPNDEPSSQLYLKTVTTGEQFWPWFREQIISRPEYVAKMVGIPELANLRHIPRPQADIMLEDLIATYQREAPSTDKSKREAIAVFRKLMDHAQAKSLMDLTQESLSSFRTKIEKSGTLKSAGTRAGYYGRIKTIIGFGLKMGMDQTQIRAALDRCKVLWTSEALPSVQPSPISREDFHTLLDVAGDGFWRTWLLVAMNLCMTTEDLCELRWADINLNKGTYAAVRVKTRRDRIPRAGVFWAETLEALKKIKQRSEYVFTSSHGTRFNKNTKVNDFAELREKAGLPDTVKFNHIRDGAYTAACQATTDERWARVLAGHRATGLLDSYVLRSPEVVRPACEAVYKVYGPFPTAK